MWLRIGFAVLALAACADEGGSETGASAPNIVLGADGVGIDVADGDCRVVLRQVARVSNGRGGYETDCTSGSCRWVWQGELAVAADVVGVPAVLVSTLESSGWFAVEATIAGPAVDGFVPWTFRVSEHTPAEGTSGTGLARAKLNVIPYLRTTDGGRLFDHNRVVDAFASYELTSSNGFAIEDDGVTCRAGQVWPTWRFSYPEFGEALVDGPVLAGGSVRIAYDGRRLREVQQCLGSHGSVQGTNLAAHWRFDNGVVGTAEVERWVSNAGQVDATATEPLVPVPVGARSMDVWFTCTPGFDGAPNVRYDSNDGANYRAPVVGGARAVDWVGGWKMFRGRAGDTVALPEPIDYRGFSNMALAAQVSVYVEGVTDQVSVDTALLRVWVESDAIGCVPGTTALQELTLWKAHQGEFGNDAVYQWPFESDLGRCPRADYRYRFVVSADGGLSTTVLGNAASSADAGADAWRTIHYQ